MIILAIDPGKTVGWAVIEDGVVKKHGPWYSLLDNGEPMAPSSALAQFKDAVGNSLDELPFVGIAWEYQFTSARAKDLWEGQAQIKELVAIAAEKGISTCALTPGEWKSLIAGNGKATYAQVKKVLRLRAEADGWELPKRITDHEVAAIGIGLAAWAKQFQFECKESELPTIEEMSGSIPGITGGLSLRDYLKEIRGG